MREISWGEEKKDPPKKKEKEKKYIISIDYNGTNHSKLYYRNCTDVVQRENLITFHSNGAYRIIPYYQVHEIELTLEKF